MSCNRDKPLTKDDLKAVFDIIEKADLKPSRIYMNERDFHEITGKKCERCGGYYNKDWPSHPLDMCDLEIARQIMES